LNKSQIVVTLQNMCTSLIKKYNQNKKLPTAFFFLGWVFFSWGGVGSPANQYILFLWELVCSAHSYPNLYFTRTWKSWYILPPHER